MIHGNLGLGSQLRNSPEAYMRFAQLVDERLADDQLGLRVIYARICALDDTLIMSIGDEGLGMPSGPPEQDFATAATAGSGRGRALSLDMRYR